MMRTQSPLEDLKQQLKNFFRVVKIAAEAFSMCPSFIYEGQVIRPITRTFDTNDGSWMGKDWRITKVEFPFFWAVANDSNFWHEWILGEPGNPFTVKFDIRNRTYAKVDNS